MDNLFKWSKQGLAALHGQERINRNQADALTGAFRVLMEAAPPGDDEIRRRRFGVVAVAIASAPEDTAPWGSHLMEAYRIGRHFEAHCLLNEHDHGDRLRQNYGTEIEEITPAEARRRAVHWRKIKGTWPWHNFHPREMADKGNGLTYVEPHLMDMLEELRAYNDDQALLLTSAYRTPERNRITPGAAKASKHMLGQAVDVRVSNLDPVQLVACAKACEFAGIAQYADAAVPRVHLDVRPQGSWIAAPMGEFNPHKDYLGADEERVTEPPADKSLGGVVGAGGAAATIGVLQSMEDGFFSAVTNITDTITKLATAVGQELLPIAGGVVAVYSAYQYRRQIWARLKAAIWSSQES